MDEHIGQMELHKIVTELEGLTKRRKWIDALVIITCFACVGLTEYERRDKVADRAIRMEMRIEKMALLKRHTIAVEWVTGNP